MKNKTIADESDTGMTELDRLVTLEIDALQQKSRKSNRVKKEPTPKPHRADNVIPHEGWPKDNHANSNQPPALNANAADNLEHYQAELEDDLVPDDDNVSELASNSELFTEEEQEFIQRCTSWLGSRKNKDLIISSIWEQLTESLPETFYSVSNSDAPGAETPPIEDSHITDNSLTQPPESSD